MLFFRPKGTLLSGSGVQQLLISRVKKKADRAEINNVIAYRTRLNEQAV